MADTTNPAALLAHAEWLRALARRLVGSSGADDAVQDTFVAALKSPPDATVPPRPWLARVLRNTTRMAHRGATRRADREDASARLAIAAEAPDAAVQRVETFRMLVELVLALDEPLRTTLVRHYFDGDKLADIARRDGVPEGTIRWRHKQALEQLRARLDARGGGDRRAWLAALAPLAGPSAHATTFSIGAILVNKIAIGAVIAAVAGVVAWRLVPGEASSSSAAARTGVVASAPAADDRAALSPANPGLAVAPRHVRQLANADERRALADQIAASQARHSAPRAPALPAPTLADDDAPNGANAAAAAPAGDMDKDTIRGAMREVIPFLATCYDAARPTLHADHLAVHAHLTLTGDPDIGTIIDADQLLDENDQPIAPALDDCLRSTLQTLELPPLADGARVDVNYPLLFADAPPPDAHGSAQQRNPVE